MEEPTKPTEAAPAYEDLVHTHPANNQQSSSAYTTVPQVDNDIELHHPVDEESHPSNNMDLTKPHFHCEVCDRQLERRENRDKEKSSCIVVGATFIVAIVCVMLLVIVIVQTNSGE